MNKARKSILNILPLAILVVITGVLIWRTDSIETYSVELTVENVDESEVQDIVDFLLDEEFLGSIVDQYSDYKNNLQERIFHKVDRKQNAATGKTETQIQIGFQYSTEEDLEEDAKAITHLFKSRAEQILPR